LVVERTTESFVRGILSLLRDAAIRLRMGCAGRGLVARKYSPEVVARSMLKLYMDVIEEHTKKPISRKARVFRSAFGRHQQARS
jgi:glycosyltransferase involved in cell wall biosynthesis